MRGTSMADRPRKLSKLVVLGRRRAAIRVPATTVSDKPEPKTRANPRRRRDSSGQTRAKAALGSGLLGFAPLCSGLFQYFFRSKERKGRAMTDFQEAAYAERGAPARRESCSHSRTDAELELCAPESGETPLPRFSSCHSGHGDRATGCLRAEEFGFQNSLGLVHGTNSGGLEKSNQNQTESGLVRLSPG